MATAGVSYWEPEWNGLLMGLWVVYGTLESEKNDNLPVNVHLYVLVV